MIVARPRFSKFLLICPPLGSVIDFFVTRYPFRQIESTFAEFLNFLVDFGASCGALTDLRKSSK